jgi:hypothetical protein
MALNFPSNPNTNDIYTTDTATWQYDGVAWNIAPSASATFPNAYGTVVANGTSLTATESSDSLRINAGDNIIISSDTETNTLTINSTSLPPEQVGFYIAADDSTQRLLSNGETLQFIGGTGITTSSDAEGNITIAAPTLGNTFAGLSDVTSASLTIDKIYEPAIAMLRVDNVGTTAFTFNSHYSGNNPTVYVISGTTIAFDLSGITDLPFEIQDSTGTNITTNLTHVTTTGIVTTGADAQGKSGGTLYWKVPENLASPPNYRYQCATQVAMVGAITIKDLSTLT